MARFLQTPPPLNSRQSVLVALDTPPPAPRPPWGPLGLGRRPRTVCNLDRTALAGGDRQLPGSAHQRGSRHCHVALGAHATLVDSRWPRWTETGVLKPGGGRQGRPESWAVAGVWGDGSAAGSLAPTGRLPAILGFVLTSVRLDFSSRVLRGWAQGGKAGAPGQGLAHGFGRRRPPKWGPPAAFSCGGEAVRGACAVLLGTGEQGRGGGGRRCLTGTRPLASLGGDCVSRGDGQAAPRCTPILSER